MKEIKYYKEDYMGLKKYKDDKLFRKEIPNVDMLISMIEDDETLYKNYIRDNNIFPITFIHIFENRKDDIKWFYDNKDKYFKDIIRYEDINKIIKSNNFKDDVCSYCCHDCITLFKRCQSGNYMNAYLQLYVYNYLYLYTSDILSPKYEDFINEKELVKDAILFLVEVINKTYQTYKNSRTQNRDIFKENADFILLLTKYSEDPLFIKEVPNIYKIIDKLEMSLLTNNEDDAYKAYWLISDIRNSIKLYEEFRDDMEFFYNNRDLSKFIYKDILEINKDEYKGILFNYIIMYEKSKKFEDIYNYITTTYFILKIDNVEIDIGYEDESIREFLKWVIDEINK